MIERRAFIGGVLVACAGSLRAADGTINERMSGDFMPVHDPSIIKQGDWYYVFCTTSKDDAGGFIACRRSRDLVRWDKIGFVLANVPAWAIDAVPKAKGIWAPDISFFNGEYHLYYSVSTFGSNRSVIGLATGKSLDPSDPEFGWMDRGLVLQSRFHDGFNAIDPNLFVDRDGATWLSWGSFWEGIKLSRIDPKTGKRPDDAPMYSLASRNPPRGQPDAIEAPFLIARGDHYYLFASFDFCCRGVDSSYFVACGRSREITGPYVDVDGRKLSEAAAASSSRATSASKAPGTTRCCARRALTISFTTPMTPNETANPLCAFPLSTGRRMAGRARNSRSSGP